MMILTKTYSFEVAHRLPDWPGIHGHSYEIDISVSGEGDYAYPLDAFDAAVEPALKIVDHTMLNDAIPVPTMENIARWFWDNLCESLPLARIVIRRPTLRLACEYTRPGFPIK